ncbi:MAG: hypothetical protein AAGA93_08250 [Actinomycetota bacterium]
MTEPPSPSATTPTIDDAPGAVTGEVLTIGSDYDRHHLEGASVTDDR